MKTQCLAATLCLASLHALPAQAFVLVTVREVGADVVVSGAGSLKVSGLTYGGASGYTYGIAPDTSTFLINPGPSSAIYQGSFTLPGVLGPGTTNNLPTSGTGDSFGIAIYFSTLTLFVPNNSNGQYNGAAFTSTSTYTNQTIAGMGLTPGSYTWSWGSGANADSITMQIGTVPPAPAPGPLPMLGAAAAMAMSRRLRRRSSAQSPRRDTGD